MKSRLKGKISKDQTMVSRQPTFIAITINILECDSIAEVYFDTFTHDKMKKKERCRS